MMSKMIFFNLLLYELKFIVFFRLTTNEILDLIEQDDSDLSDLSDNNAYDVVFMPPA